MRIPAADNAAQAAPVDGAFRQLAATRDDLAVIYPSQTLCRKKACVTEIDGAFLYRDAGHFRRNLATGTLRRLARRMGLTAAVRRLLPPDEAGGQQRVAD